MRDQKSSGSPSGIVPSARLSFTRFLCALTILAAVCALPFCALPFCVLPFCVLPVSAQNNEVEAIRETFFKGDFGKVISTYSRLPADTRDNPLVCFWVGQSYLRCHDIEHAEEFLRKAQNGNLPKQQAERARDNLERIGTLKQLRPPLYHDYSADGYTIRIFAKDSAWSKGIAAQMPIFLKRGREAFGPVNNYVAFYLFEDRASYDKFFGSWGPGVPDTPHKGTGGRQIVMFCRYFPTGQEIGAKNVNDLYARVLHEYSHALCNTTYGDGFRMPEWLNEGMADYFCWYYNPNGAAQAVQRVQKLAATRSARTYEDISKRLYDDSELGYPISDVMINELMAGKPLSTYAQIISTARASGSNFEYALKQTTDRDPRAIYAQLVKTYWKK